MCISKCVTLRQWNYLWKLTHELARSRFNVNRLLHTKKFSIHDVIGIWSVTWFHDPVTLQILMTSWITYFLTLKIYFTKHLIAIENKISVWHIWCLNLSTLLELNFLNIKLHSQTLCKENRRPCPLDKRSQLKNTIYFHYKKN